VRVVVTGGSGKAGRAVVRELVAHDHQVLNVDLVPDPEPVCEFRRADLDELGQAYEVLDRAEAVVHLAAIPRPGLATEEATFKTNVASTFNVFSAACALGLQRVVWASSETALGLPFDETKPYFPVDEDQPVQPKSSYALSKVLGEEMARYFNARFGVPFVGLRISNIWATADYARLPSFQDDARTRSWNAWGYVDARDAAQACRLGLEVSTAGADVFIIAAADTVMERPNKELVGEVFPSVPLRAGSEGNETLLSIEAMFILLSAIPVGYLADRLDRLRMARVAAMVWGAMAVLMGLAWAIPVLFFARFFSGVARSSNEIVHTSLLADYYEPRLLPRVFKVHRFANSLSSIASLVAGLVGAALGWPWAFILLALPTFALVSGLTRLHEPIRGATMKLEGLDGFAPPEPTSFLTATKATMTIRTLRRIWIGFFLMGVGLLAFTQMLSLFFDRVYGLGPLGRGVVTFSFGLGSALGLLRGGEICTRYSSSGDYGGLCRVTSRGFLIFAGGVVLMALAPWAALSILMAPLASSGLGLVTPALPTLMMRVLPPHIRSQAQSFCSLAIAVGALFAIPVTGLGDALGYRPAFLVLAGILLVSAPILHSAAKAVPGDIAALDRAMAERHAAGGGVHPGA
jgi:nucleoside-diphosphate-sugar epimerase/MFS family permease